MSQTVLVIDTSILCVWLAVPHLDTCGPDNDRWDKTRVDALIDEHLTKGATLVLPLASIIETGNHIAQNKGDRFVLAQQLCDRVRKAVDGTAPYAAFSEQSVLWEREHLQRLTTEWPSLAARSISLADATIRDVAHFYARRGVDVHTLTGDKGLQSLAPPPVAPSLVPRRNKGRL